MRAILIVNPASGDDEPNEKKVPRILEMLAAGPLAVEVATTSPEKSAGELARESVEKGFEAVIAGGGDGTVSEVARELTGGKAILGILPIGTFNNISRSLGITADLEAACSVVACGWTRKVDIAVANETHFFFEAAGAGLDATLFPIGEEIKSGRWNRTFFALKLAFEYRAQPIVITFDRPTADAIRPKPAKLSRHLRTGRTIRRNSLLTVVANGPYYGVGFTVAPGARLNDGLLTVSVYRRFSKLELARHFWSISRGKYRYSPKIETYYAASITLESPADLPVHLDGQPFGNLPIRLRAVPGALRVFSPEDRESTADHHSPVALPALGNPASADIPSYDFRER